MTDKLVIACDLSPKHCRCHCDLCCECSAESLELRTSSSERHLIVLADGEVYLTVQSVRLMRDYLNAFLQEQS